MKFRKPSFSFLRPKLQPLIGVDITGSAVKLLEIHPLGKKLQVVSYGVAPLELGAVSDRRIVDYKSVVKSIKQVMQRTEPSTKRAAVALPATSVITRTLNLPRNLSNKELENQIYLEADQHIPYPLAEVALDFQRLPPINENDDTQPILLVASRKELTVQLDNLLLDADLEPVAIDVESFATERAINLILEKLPAKEQSQLVAVADIGASSSTFSVLDKGEIIYSRDFSFGGKQLTEEIQRAFGLSRGQAGYAKKTGKLPPEYKTEILQPFIGSAIQQIDRQQQLFYSNSSYQSIDKLLLAGGSSAIEGLPKQVEDLLGVPTFIANPFMDMLLGEKVNAQALAQDAPAMVVACGLALRVNL